MTRTALVGLAAAMLAACGSDPEERPAGEAAPQRLGCGEYCQNAGGYGDGANVEAVMRIETLGRVTAVDGAVPVELSCLRREPCRGAILVSASPPDELELGRSDLYVEGRSSATIAVPLSAEAMAALERAGGSRRGLITADYGDPECPPKVPCLVLREVEIDAGT
jgi:hypothetical protein